jgi:hypothetical protein
MSYLSGYTDREKVTIKASKVADTLSDFPVYIDLSDMSDDWWDVVASGGGDIRVTRSDGVTECAREVVSCDTVNKTGELHFLANSVSGSSDTDFYIYVNGTNADYDTDDTYGAEAVWGDYMYVSHNGGGDDATGNGNTGTANGGVTLGGAVGPFGDATDYDGEDDYSNIGFKEMGAELASFTNQFWIKTEDTTANAAILGSVNNNSTNAYFPRLNTESNDIGFFIRQDTTPTIGTRITYLSSPTVNDDSWHQMILVNTNYATRDGQIYKNGQAVTTTLGGFASGLQNTFNNFQYDVYIGANNLRDSDVTHLEAVLAEIRFTTSLLSSDWIETEYNNQSDASDFYNTTFESDGEPPTANNTGFFLWYA